MSRVDSLVSDPSGSGAGSLFGNLLLFGRLVKFSHTVFALPFALSILVVIAREQLPTAVQIIWILVCLVCARTAAMSFNRLLDARIDALNPRTSARELPSGAVSPMVVGGLCGAASLGFVIGSGMLGMHCLVWAPFVLSILLFYSWTKRFTSLSHLVLGLSLALAPGGVWFALTAQYSWIPIPLMLAVLAWVAGFDILYSCQDEEFDREQKLWSIPSRFGAERAFRFAKLFHLAAVLLLILFGEMAGMGLIYLIGVLAFAVLLLSQYLVVSPANLSRMDAAFFTRNGWASVVFFAGVVLDTVMGSVL